MAVRPSLNALRRVEYEMTLLTAGCRMGPTGSAECSVKTPPGLAVHGGWRVHDGTPLITEARWSLHTRDALEVEDLAGPGGPYCTEA